MQNLRLRVKFLPKVQFHTETCKSEVEKLKRAEDLEILDLDTKERDVDQRVKDFDDMVTKGIEIDWVYWKTKI